MANSVRSEKPTVTTYSNNFHALDPIQTLPILYFIKQGTIRDFGLETITSQEIIEKINQLSNPTSSNQTSQVESIPPPQVDTTSSPQTNDTSAEAKAAKKAE